MIIAAGTRLGPYEIVSALGQGGMGAVYPGNFENANEAWYDVSADGQRFLMLKPADDGSTVGSIVVIQDWMDTVKSLVAAKQ